MHNASPLVPFRPLRAAILALALLAGGCGGGGGSAPVTDLGLLASTVPTSVPFAVMNPLAAPAIVSAVAGPGPFGFDPALFPAAVPGAAEILLAVRFHPTGPGPASGEARLLFDDGTTQREEVYLFRALAEDVALVFDPPLIDAGAVAPGSFATIQSTLRNASALSPVSLHGSALPTADWTLVGASGPVTLGPGDQTVLTLRYEPLGEGLHYGAALLGASDPGGPARLPLFGRTPLAVGEHVVDYGPVPVSGGETPLLLVDVPPEAISLSLLGVAGPGQTVTLSALHGPGGMLYRESDVPPAGGTVGPLVTAPSTESLLVQIPNSDRVGGLLVPGGGTYSFRMRRTGGGTLAVRAIVEMRPGGLPAPARLDLNVWIAQGLPLDAASAPGDAMLQAILARAEAILAQAGIALGDIAYYDIADDDFNRVTSQFHLYDLLRTTSAATDTRLNVALVFNVFQGGVIGVSGAIGIPPQNGLATSGLALAHAVGLTVNVEGALLAHEVGHCLGLFHTREKNGDLDPVDDTSPCPASLPPGGCADLGLDNLMHWVVDGGDALTPGQVRVIQGHPLLRPDPAPVSPKESGFARALRPWTSEDAAQWMGLRGWSAGCCGCEVPSRDRDRGEGPGALGTDPSKNAVFR